jgi:predicted lipoprotein with Yx(FWY)xxD motif
MKIARFSAIAWITLLAAVTAACGIGSGGTGNGGTSGSTGAQIAASTSAGLGPVLVDSTGKTLYFADGESAGTIKCTGACLGFWTPLSVAANATPKTSTGLTATVATVQRSDGKTQVTYNGHPLYTFKLDTSKGQAKGNNFTDDFGGTAFTWHAVTTAGTAAAATSPSDTSGGYAPGY